MWNIKKIVSKGDYNYAVVPEHPNATKNGYVLEHRIVMENYLGRLLDADEVVHHMNRTCCSSTCRGKFSRYIQLHGETAVVERAISGNIVSFFNTNDDNPEQTS